MTIEAVIIYQLNETIQENVQSSVVYFESYDDLYEYIEDERQRLEDAQPQNRQVITVSSVVLGKEKSRKVQVTHHLH